MIHLFSLRKATLFICLCLSQPAESAEFKKSPIKAGGPDFIEVVGDLALGDEKKFVDVAISSADAVVVFIAAAAISLQEWKSGGRFALRVSLRWSQITCSAPLRAR